MINSDTGGSSVAQYWLLLLHLKKNDLPAAMVGNYFRCWRDSVLESVVSRDHFYAKRLQIVAGFLQMVVIGKNERRKGSGKKDLTQA